MKIVVFYIRLPLLFAVTIRLVASRDRGVTRILSITGILNAAMKNDAGEGSVHDNPHGHGKEVMVEAPKKKISKKDLRRM
jgi:hypothetical protein